MSTLNRRFVVLYTAAFLVSILALVTIFLVKSIHAQEGLKSVSLSVSPQSLDTAINPGQSTTHIFRVTNGSESTLSVQPTPKNFVPSGNEGAIRLEEGDTPYSLADWLNVEPSGVTDIKNGQTFDFKVTIAVPENADPGGHFGSVVFRTIPSNQPRSAAAISQEIAPVILVRVPGDANEDASISKFGAQASMIYQSKPITFEALFKNHGNVHIKPAGTISIFNIFGKQVASFPLSGNNVIPGAERKMNAIWEDPGFRIGMYTARLTAVYGSENRILTADTSFTILHLKQVLPIFIILFIISLVLYKIRRRVLLAAKILLGKHSN